MRIAIVGAGPGGLYLSILMRARARARDVVVFERHAEADPSGRGVTFGQAMLDTLTRADPPAFEALGRQAVAWDRIAVCRHGERVEVRSDRFAGIRRTALMGALRARAASLGVTLRYSSPVRDVRALPDVDLLVGADGAHSTVRQAAADVFEPQLRSGNNLYAWFGVNRRVPCLTLAFRRTPAGAFAAHAYPIDEGHSTVVVECAQRTWSRSGLDRRTDPDACSHLSDVFAEELDGHLLRPSGLLRWRPFLLVENRRWHAGRTVLIGDALHTVHFSTGAGTQLAIDDTVALVEALDAESSIDRALDAFEAARRPAAEAARLQAHASLSWFEHLDRLLSLPADELAYQAVTETRRIDPVRLATLDPGFHERVRRPPQT